MKYIIGLVKKNFINKEFVLFIIIGTANTFNGTVLSLLYSMFLQANIAFVMGYITGLIIAYFLNSFFVFKRKPQFFRLIKFAISYIPNFIIQNVCVLILYNWLNWNRLIVFAFAAAVGIPITFLILKVFAFGKKEGE